MFYGCPRVRFLSFSCSLEAIAPQRKGSHQRSAPRRAFETARQVVEETRGTGHDRMILNTSISFIEKKTNFMTYLCHKSKQREHRQNNGAPSEILIHHNFPIHTASTLESHHEPLTLYMFKMFHLCAVCHQELAPRGGVRPSAWCRKSSRHRT